MRRSRRSVTALIVSARARSATAIFACTGAAVNSLRRPSTSRCACGVRLIECAAELLGADVILVAFLDLAPRQPALVEPGSVRRAEVLDEPGISLADDGRVLAAHLAGVDHEVAMLAASDEEAILADALQLVPVAGQEHQRAAGCSVRRFPWMRADDRRAGPQAAADVRQIQARWRRVRGFFLER